MEARPVSEVRTHDDFLDIAWQAAAIGSKTLGSSRPGTVKHKGDRDLVTDIDMAIQHEIADFLRIATPDVELLAEESTQQPDIAAAEWLWVLDPIDGTSNFAHGLPLCAVSLALVHRGSAVIAVTQAPLLGRTYHAVEGRGAFCNGQPITASRTESLDKSIVSLGDYAVGPDAAAQNRRRLALTAHLVPLVERIRMVGAATLDLAFVAEGALDACVMMSNKPWDTAAGALMARESGALVTDARGDSHTYQAGSIVAAAPAIAGELATVINADRPAVPWPTS
jgi:myo-inositol-1(or 4)-monophosphatase